jgi:hypothetical protein
MKAAVDGTSTKRDGPSVFEVIDAGLDNQNGNPRYEVEVLKHGSVQKVIVDAQSGQVVTASADKTPKTRTERNESSGTTGSAHGTGPRVDRFEGRSPATDAGETIMTSGARGYLVLATALASTLGPAVAFAQAGNAPIPVQEQPVAPETNPPGDIPDSQVFVRYQSPLGFVVQVPEGWARTDLNDGVRFTDKYDTAEVTVTSTAAPSVKSVADTELATLNKQGRAVHVKDVKSVSLPAGPAVLIEYSSNSEPNPVTNKQIRLENNRYIFAKNNKVVRLDLAAPFGADNVDQWQFMASQFSWS